MSLAWPMLAAVGAAGATWLYEWSPARNPPDSDERSSVQRSVNDLDRRILNPRNYKHISCRFLVPHIPVAFDVWASKNRRIDGFPSS